MAWPELILSRWSVGSGLFLASFAAVMGPMNYAKHLLSTPRLPFTAAYFGSITMTLVFAIKVSFVLRDEGTAANVCKAPKHYSHLVRGAGADCLFNLVSDQLFSHGFNWSAPCHIVWSKAGDFLDEWLRQMSS